MPEWRNWQTHGTQKPNGRITEGKEPYPLYTLRPAMLRQGKAHLPQNHYKTTTVDAREPIAGPLCPGEIRICFRQKVIVHNLEFSAPPVTERRFEVDISVPSEWNATAAEVTERGRAAMDD